jgi:hypothetical protein
MSFSKLAAITLASLIVYGCSWEGAEHLPTAPDTTATTPTPPPTPGALTWLWGMVIDSNGACIVGARVEVVAGQGLGQVIEQRTPCGAWDYDGGFEFRELTPSVAMTLSASAPGWTVQEKTFVPTLGPQMAVFLKLSGID